MRSKESLLDARRALPGNASREIIHAVIIACVVKRYLAHDQAVCFSNGVLE
jgi:hypothetical protein